jgi:hypothetical protein
VSTNNSDSELDNEQEHNIDDEDINKILLFSLFFPNNSIIKKKIQIRSHSANNEIDGISKENWKLLEKVKLIQRRDYIKVKGKNSLRFVYYYF